MAHFFICKKEKMCVIISTGEMFKLFAVLLCISDDLVLM